MQVLNGNACVSKNFCVDIVYSLKFIPLIVIGIYIIYVVCKYVTQTQIQCTITYLDSSIDVLYKLVAWDIFVRHSLSIHKDVHFGISRNSIAKKTFANQYIPSQMYIP